MQQGVERTPLPLDVESSFEESFALVSPFRNDELNAGKSFFGGDSNVGRSDWDKFQSLPSPFEFGIDLDMEQEFFKSDMNVDCKVVGPTLAELNDHRSLSPLINPEMERLHRIATRTDENSSSSAVTSRKPQSYIALEYSEEKTDIPVIQVKKEPSKSNGECSEGFGNNVAVRKGGVERKLSCLEPSWTVTQSNWGGIHGTSKESVSNGEERSSHKLMIQGKLASEMMTKVPTLISAQMKSQIYTDDHEDRSLKKEEIATNQNATVTDPGSPAVDDESADEEMDSDEDFEVENLSQEAGLMRNRKGRRGEVDDLSPNPKKLLEISRELHRLNKVIGDLKPINKLPQNARNRSRKEKNKLASRACRLKKKAQHEANKVKLHGLELEQQRLTEVIDKVKKEILKGSCRPLIHKGSLSSQVEELIKATFGNQLVAGHTSDFVHSVLKATARSTPSLEGLDGLSMCF